MKKEIIMGSFVILLIPLPSMPVAMSSEQWLIKTRGATPGEIISLKCSNEYPSLGEPLSILITIAGKAQEKFNETIIITDELHGVAASAGNITWISANVTIYQTEITIGKLPTYTKKIPWYPSVVGNHTFHVTAGIFPEKQLNVCISFDVEGIISPSLGCPSLLCKNKANELPVMISEKRKISEEPAQIIQVELLAINSTAQYHLENQTTLWRTWVKAETDLLEDELLAGYTISSIPDGLYNISVTTTKKTYSWPHAVKIRNNEPTEYTVVHLSDIHMGKFSNLMSKKKEVSRLISYMNENIHPDFIILSGDSVDWYNEKSKRNAYADLQEILLSCNAPVYTTPGNHERYGNGLLFLYFPFTNLTAYHRYLTPLCDYSFQYGDVNYMFLDSGYDYSRWEIQPQIWNTTPEGSGLTNTQMYLIENSWGASSMNQIITMHHIAANDRNDTGTWAVPNSIPSGNDECIAFNRGAFIAYCSNKNISLVLTGHSHENHVFTSQGKETSNYSAWPLFVQTDSATLSKQNNGGRVIHIKNSAVIGYEFVPFH